MHRLLVILLLLAVAPLAAAQDPLTSKALKRIAEVEAAEPGIQAGDVQAANLQLNRLAWAGKRLMAVNDKTEATWKEAEKRYRAVWDKLEKKAGATPPKKKGYDHAKLVALNHAVTNSLENLKLLRIEHLADAGRAQGFRKEIADFKARIAAFPKDDADVKTVAGNIDILSNAFDETQERIAEDRKALEEITPKLDAITARYDLALFPARLEEPFSEQQVRSWAAQLEHWEKDLIPQDLAWLASIYGNTVVDKNRVNSLHSYLTVSWKPRIEEAEMDVRERIATGVRNGLDTAQHVLDTDPNNRDHVIGRILGRGAFDGYMQRLNDGLHAIAVARAFDDATGRPAISGPAWSQRDPSQPVERPDRDAQRDKVAGAIAHLETMARHSLQDVRMPEAASTDEELLKIAAETLKRKDYEIAGWERLVINAPKRRVSRKEAWLKPGTSYATVTFYDYTWDQFQVTTAEKVGDEVWLFANTLKLYHSGDPTSPVGRWVLSRRFELTPILAENVQE